MCEIPYFWSIKLDVKFKKRSSWSKCSKERRREFFWQFRVRIRKHNKQACSWPLWFIQEKTLPVIFLMVIYLVAGKLVRDFREASLLPHCLDGDDLRNQFSIFANLCLSFVLKMFWDDDLSKMRKQIVNKFFKVTGWRECVRLSWAVENAETDCRVYLWKNCQNKAGNKFERIISSSLNSSLNSQVVSSWPIFWSSCLTAL